MRRRDFIGGMIISSAWPLGVRAQQPDRMRFVGMLTSNAESDPSAQSEVAAFRTALSKLGWKEGQNLRIEIRWGAADPAKIKTLAKELVELQPDAIFGARTPVINALSRETRKIPIVFAVVADPIASGFAASLRQPAGNITGFTNADTAMGGKWVELLKEIAPRTASVALLFNPDIPPPIKFYLPAIRAAASSFGIQASVAPVHTKDEIEGAIAGQARSPGGSLIAMPGAFSVANREMIGALAIRYSLPSISVIPSFADAGGLMAYGSDFDEQFRQAAGYVDRILKGAKPADLPIQTPTKFELIINLKTAKLLGLQVPSQLLQIADNVIE